MSVTASEAEQIGDFVGEGAANVINGDSPASPFHAFGPRSTKGMPKARVEVRCGGFTRASDQMAQNTQGSWFYNHRRGILSFTVSSQRQALRAFGPSADHSKQVGRIRYLMSRQAQALTPDVVNGYEIVDLIDLGDNYRSDEVEGTDRTEVRFQVDLVIPPANYPTQA